MANTLLKISGLKVSYGGIKAVKGVDLEVREGELISLIGSNGAGKTTTMKAVTENLQMGAYIRKDKAGIANDIERMFGIFPRLKERKDQLAGTMSGGEQQMLAMARALMSQPKVLLLDEPSMGLSPIMVDKIFEVVRDVSAQGVTILLVEQNAQRALQIAHRGYVMDSGEITMTGSGQDLLVDPKVREAYLGH